MHPTCASGQRSARAAHLSCRAKAPAIPAVECIAMSAFWPSSLEKVHSWDSTSAPVPGPASHPPSPHNRGTWLVALAASDWRCATYSIKCQRSRLVMTGVCREPVGLLSLASSGTCERCHCKTHVNEHVATTAHALEHAHLRCAGGSCNRASL